MIKWIFRVWISTVIFVSAGAKDDSISEQKFLAPPFAVGAQTWWHWMGRFISKEGITADLESIKAAGLSGVTLFQIRSMPRYDPEVPKGMASPDVKALSDEWWSMVEFAMQEAARLGLEFGIHNSPGWSSSGGPWTSPELSMQKIVWSENAVVGPARFERILSQPHVDPVWNYYRDIGVVAIKANAVAGAADKTASAVDLSSRMNADGVLTWDVPAGNWTILRFGHTTTGARNVQSPDEASGLECDKMSEAAVRAHFEAFSLRAIKTARKVGPAALRSILIDSYEAGLQNWTPRFREEFVQRRGYDPLIWLPVIAGHLLGGEQISRRFRWDMDRTIAELFAEKYYGTMAKLTHEHLGIQFRVEPYGGPFDSATVGGKADIVAGEFWVKPEGQSSLTWSDPRTVISSAHTYGKRIAAGEAFTANPWAVRWDNSPASLKASGDLAYARGINRIELHTVVHQAWPNVRPGLQMMYHGMQFGRYQTWWEEAASWFSYMRRCQYLLQQGDFVADVCFLGRDNRPPEGFAGDTCSEELVLAASVQDGRLILPSGMSYGLLVLPESKAMLPDVAAKIKKLVGEGLTVLGPRPEHSPSLAGFPEVDNVVRSLGEEVWGRDYAKTGAKQFGAGRTIWGISIEEALKVARVSKDFTVLKGRANDLAWTHRRTSEADIYFISNQSGTRGEFSVQVRVSGRVPEFWYPDTGRTDKCAQWAEHESGIEIPLSLDVDESLFIVLRNESSRADPVVRGKIGAEKIQAGRDGAYWVETFSPGEFTAKTRRGRELEARVDRVPTPIELNRDWRVKFTPGWGAPRETVFPDLISWTDSDDVGIKYYSGKACYVKEIEIPAERFRDDQRHYLNLGRVENLASVNVNGVDVAVLWKPPFRAEVTAALRPGKNLVEITVTNLWANRLIGDEQEPADVQWGDRVTSNDGHNIYFGRMLMSLPEWFIKNEPRPARSRYTLTTWNFFDKASPLLPSGLLGPVRLETAVRVPMK